MTTQYQQAVELVIRTQRCGIYHLVTHLGCYFYEASRMVRRMEHEGIVSAIQQDGNRQVLKKDALQ